MIKSMTGYGRAEHHVSLNERRVICELKSVNHRFLELTLRLPRSLQQFENRLRRVIRKHISRGYVTVRVGFEEEGNLEGIPSLDIHAAEHLYGLLNELKERLHLNGEVDLSLLVQQSGVLREPKEEPSTEKEWELVQPVLEEALAQLVQMRTEEGKRIEQDLLMRLDRIVKHVDMILELSRQRVNEKRDGLRQKLDQLLEGRQVSEDRLEQEVVFFAEKSDTTEECVRLQSHVEHFHGFLAEERPVGRRLDFLLQEMNREANTISSKASDANIAHCVVSIKEEVERLREQVQNIE